MPRKLAFLAAPLLALAVLLSGCGSHQAAPNSAAAPSETTSEAARTHYPLTIQDDTGQRLTFTSAPTRVAAFIPSATDMILALGQKDRLVAIDKYSAPQYPQVTGVAVMDSYDVDFERLVALKPDLVLTLPGPYLQKMHDLGLPVFILQPADAEGILQDLGRLGQVLDVQGKADQVVAGLRAKTQAVEKDLAAISGQPRVKVFFETSDNPIFTAGKGSYVDSLITAAGGINIFGDQNSAYPQVSAEEVIRRAPDVIIGTKSDQSMVDLKAHGRAGWENVPAVKNGRIYLYDDTLLVQADTHVADAIRALARDLYPDAVGSR